MFEKETAEKVQRALLVGVFTEKDQEREAESLLDELEELAGTLGIPVFGKKLIYLRELQARLFVGSGKAEEIIEEAKKNKVDLIIFDHELSAAQQRNWEQLSGLAVIDREEVILDIFAKRAHTKEARLQVELAQLEYSLPRLTRAWSHFGQQTGGIGTRGEGEMQLELDRRIVRKRIDRLKRELELVKKRRATQRKDRKRVPVPNVAIVGYTNAGKSSLLNRLTHSDVLVEDKLFATLDTTTRRVELPNHQPLLLTDTVGFVRKLPHGLVEAFNATLEEAVLANYLIHLLDASQSEVFKFYQTTMDELRALGASEKRMLTVFNKIDQVEDRAELSALKREFPMAYFISVKTGEGLEELIEGISDLLKDELITIEVNIPQDRSDLIARLHREGKVLKTVYEDDGVHMTAIIHGRHLHSYQGYRQEDSGLYEKIISEER